MGVIIMATVKYVNGIKITGNMEIGKVYQSAARWAKVLCKKLPSGATRTSVALWVAGDNEAFLRKEFDCIDDSKARAEQRQFMQMVAAQWVEEARLP